MSSKRLSPTASLLRTSRLFSLPPTFQRPILDYRASAGADTSSDSATLPYPIQQAIETPQSSLSRGDWGLKRPLPLRSTTNSSNPSFHVNAIDTVEHITDFESAANHVATVQKWQTMGTPMTTYVEDRARAQRRTPRSVYEDEFDNTIAPKNRSEVLLVKQRWKFKGPWVAGMTPSEFEEYVKKQLVEHKGEFRELIRERIRQDKHASRIQTAREEGNAIPQSAADIEITDQELHNHMKVLRVEFGLGSDLARLIREFLDLPNLPSNLPNETLSFTNRNHTAQIAALQDVFQTSAYGPPKTHPGAGLTYTKTNAVLENHPILGPRSNHTPVQARILQPKHKTSDGQAIIGVGGVVTKMPLFYEHLRVGVPLSEKKYQPRDPERGIQRHDLSAPGGTKIWVSPERASIDSRGRIELVVSHADRTTIGVHTEEYIREQLEGLQTSERAKPLPGYEVPAGQRLEGLLDAPEFHRSSAGRRPADTAEIVRRLEEEVDRRAKSELAE